MNNFRVSSSKCLSLITVSLLVSGINLIPEAQAATFTAPTSSVSEPSSDGFTQINQEFILSNLLSIDSLTSQVIALDASANYEQQRKALEITLMLGKIDSVTRSALNFETVVNSLKQLKFSFNQNQEIEVPILAQVGFADVYDGIYEFKGLQVRRSPIDRLVGDYLAFNPRAVTETVLPRSYFYNNNAIEIGIARANFAGLPDRVAVGSYLNGATGEINSPDVQEGLELNRVRPEEDNLDSTLQLWPRNPLSLEVSGYGSSTSAESQVVAQFGHLTPTVNLPLMPKDILVNQLDLEVDWVNEGEYSSNLRRDVQTISEQNREAQETFQSRVEQQQTQNYTQQQDYQRQLQQIMSINFQRSGYIQQRNSRTPGLSRYSTPRTNLNLTPRTNPSVPQAVPSNSYKSWK